MPRKCFAPRQFLSDNVHMMQQLTFFSITPVALALSSLSLALFHELSLSFVLWGLSFPLRPIRYVFLVWKRPESKWSYWKTVAWMMGSSKSPWPLWAGGRWWPQGPSHGQFSTEKVPAKAYCNISMVWREAMETSLGKNAGEWDLENSWFYLGLGLLSVQLVCWVKFRTESGRESSI